MRTKEDVVEEFRKQTICDAAMLPLRDEILGRAMDGATAQLLDQLAAACKGCRSFRDLLEQRVRTQLQHFEENRDFFRMYLAMAVAPAPEAATANGGSVKVTLQLAPGKAMPPNAVIWLMARDAGVSADPPLAVKRVAPGQDAHRRPRRHARQPDGARPERSRRGAGWGRERRDRDADAEVALTPASP